MKRFFRYVAYWALAGALVPTVILTYAWLTETILGLEAVILAPSIYLLTAPIWHLPTAFKALVITFVVLLNAILYSIIGAISWLVLGLFRRIAEMFSLTM